MYSQRDGAWKDKVLGESGLRCESFGCTATDVAQALKLAGYDVDPGSFIDKMNSIGGFTDKNYKYGAGLLIWAKVEEAYPQFHFGGDGYRFIKGSWGKYQHWILEHNGVKYDPFYGTESAPQGFVEIDGSRTASIDPAPQPEPAPAPQPAEQTPQPSPAPEQAPEEFQYTVVKGDNLTNICASHYGLDKANGDAYRKALEIAKHNGIEDPNLIYPGQVIKLP